MASKQRLERNPNPTDSRSPWSRRESLGRSTGYQHIVNALRSVGQCRCGINEYSEWQHYSQTGRWSGRASSAPDDSAPHHRQATLWMRHPTAGYEPCGASWQSARGPARIPQHPRLKRHCSMPGCGCVHRQYRKRRPVPCGASLPGLRRAVSPRILATDSVYFVVHAIAVLWSAKDAHRPRCDRLD